MEIASDYPYLFGASVLFGLLLIGLGLSAERRRTTMLAAALSGPLSLASVLFVPEYWSPARVACYLAGPEDFIFSLATGGIAWLVATWPSRNRILTNLSGRRVAWRYVCCSAPGLLLAILLWACGVGIMAAALISMGLVGAVLLRLYWRWWTVPVVGGIGFSLLYFVVTRAVFGAYPQFLAQWNSNRLWGPSIMRVPIEEVLWALCFGAAFPLVMIHAFGVTNRRGEQPGAPGLPVGPVHGGGGTGG